MSYQGTEQSELEPVDTSFFQGQVDENSPALGGSVTPARRRPGMRVFVGVCAAIALCALVGKVAFQGGTTPTAMSFMTRTTVPTQSPVPAPRKLLPTVAPTLKPSPKPTDHPSPRPTDRPTNHPSPRPTDHPTDHPSPEPTAKPTSEPPTTVKVNFCDSDDYDKMETIEGGFTYDTTYDGVTCVAETTEEETWNFADYPDDFTDGTVNVTFTATSDADNWVTASANMRVLASDDASTNWFCGGYLKIGCLAKADYDEDDDGYVGVQIKIMSCDTDGSLSRTTSGWTTDYSEEDWYVQELHAHQIPRYPFAPPPLPPPSPLRYKISFTAIGDDYSCSLYAASADTAQAYGEPLLTKTYSDTSDDAVTSSGAPEIRMSYTTKAAKFTFQNMD